MKFGKNLLNIAEMSDPEWNVYWVNYKNLKKKINEIVENRGGEKLCSKPEFSMDPNVLSGSSVEVEFFKMLRRELKKTSDFYASTESIFRIRYQWVVVTGFDMLNYVETPIPPEETKPVICPYDESTWMRLLAACVKFYKDCLLLETFALTNYCAFSKILKKHDKVTGFHTREAFMRNVVSKQNFTYYPTVVELLKQSEKLFSDVQIKLKR
jgi:SPX domain protein involved in polyphosphate accumulation